MRQTIGYAVLLAALLACDSQVTPTSPVNGVSLKLSVDSTTMVVGASVRLIVRAVDQSLAPTSSSNAQVAVSDPSVAEIQNRVVSSIQDQETGRTWEQLSVAIRLRGAGPVTLRVTLGDAKDSVRLIVRDGLVHVPPVSLRLSIDTAASYTGMVTRLTVLAFDEHTKEWISSDNANVSLSDDSIAEIVGRNIVPVLDPGTGRKWDELVVAIQLNRPGLLVVYVTLGDVVESVRLTVGPDLVPSSALAVDSFTVVEYRPSCAWDCPYLVYSPLLKLREPTGTRSVEIVAVEFRIGDMTTGVCHGSVTYGPGVSEFLTGVDDYLWLNDFIFVSVEGKPLEGEARARVIVREPNGAFGVIEATGSIQRGVTNPDFPPPRDSGWSC